MTNEELKTKIIPLSPGAAFEEATEWLTVLADPLNWKNLATQLRNDDFLKFDYLFCLTCVDWKSHLSVIYHLTSTAYRHHVVVKAKLDRGNPEIETVSDIWRTAEFHEREVFELFGVTFLHHPDLRRLILPDDFEGFPLRKDFEDPVNMIKL